MPRKAEAGSRRSPRRRIPELAAEGAPHPRRKPAPLQDSAYDSDFGLALALVPALRRRPDA